MLTVKFTDNPRTFRLRLCSYGRTQIGVKWGTDSKVRLFDPGSVLHIEIGACGSFNIRVTNSRKLLLKVIGTAPKLTQGEIAADSGYSTTAMVGKFRSLVMNKVKSILAKAIKDESINILEIDEHIDELSVRLRKEINITLEDYGLTLPEFYITLIMTPDDDPNFKRLKQQFADKTLRVREEEIRKAEAETAQERRLVEAQTEAQLKMVSARGEAEAMKIKAIAEAEAYKAQALAEAKEMKAKGLYLSAGNCPSGWFGGYAERHYRELLEQCWWKSRRFSKPWRDTWSYGRRYEYDKGRAQPCFEYCQCGWQ